MFLTFIIALYDSNSPLRRYMAEHDGNLGDLWTNKHRILTSLCYRGRPSNNYNPAGPKGVIPFTLLRLGLTWGEGSKAYSSGRFNRNWGLLQPADLSTLLKDLLHKIATPPFGVGDALIALLGSEKAEEVAIKENVPMRNMVGTKRAGGSQAGISDKRPPRRQHTEDSD
jgi:hypothetical protein